MYSGRDGSSISLAAHAPPGALRCTGTSSARARSSSANPVRVMPSGSVMIAVTASSRPRPQTASTTRPSQSVAGEYMNTLPGSATSGASSTARRPVIGLGAPTACSQARTSAFQNQ